MQVNLQTIAITVDASGNFTGYTEVAKGRVVQYRYVPDGTSPLDTGADLTISGEVTGVSIASQSNIGTSAFTKAPRQASHDTAGAATLYAAAGAGVLTEIVVDGERLKVVIAQGGNALKGTLYIWIA